MVTKDEIRNKGRMWDTKVWKKEMEDKTSLKWYKEWRNEMGGHERVYDNREASVVLFKCRSNTMNLADRKRFKMKLLNV